MSEDVVKAQLIDLQTQFAFQEDMLSELNSVVIRQQSQIDALERELVMHRDKISHVLENLPDKGGADGGSDERPPHY
ncbi:MAG: SlyX family protein [Gammaproteobacteria bacterium]